MTITPIQPEDQPIYCDEHSRERAVFWVVVGGKAMAICDPCAESLHRHLDMWVGKR